MKHISNILEENATFQCGASIIAEGLFADDVHTIYVNDFNWRRTKFIKIQNCRRFMF